MIGVATIANKLPTGGRAQSATIGAVLLVAGGMLMYWAFSGWGLFGLGDGSGSGKRMVSGGMRDVIDDHDATHDHDEAAHGGGGMFRKT